MENKEIVELGKYDVHDPKHRIAGAVLFIEILLEVNARYEEHELENRRLNTIRDILTGRTTPEMLEAKAQAENKEHDKLVQDFLNRFPKIVRPFIRGLLSQ